MCVDMMCGGDDACGDMMCGDMMCGRYDVWGR